MFLSPYSYWRSKQLVLPIKIFFSLLYDIPYMQNLKRNSTNELIYKTETDLQRMNFMVTWGEEWGEEVGSLGSTCRHSSLLYLKWVINKTLLYSTGNFVQCMWQPGYKKSVRKTGYMYIYGWVPLLSFWNYHNFVNWLYPSIK